MEGYNNPTNSNLSADNTEQQELGQQEQWLYEMNLVDFGQQEFGQHEFGQQELGQQESGQQEFEQQELERQESQENLNTSEINENENISISANTSSKKFRSWVWKHFIFDEEKQKSQCNYCKQYISMNKGSTTGMAGHLKNRHHLNTKQPTLEAIIKNITAPVSYI